MQTKDLTTELKHYIETESKGNRFSDYIIFYGNDNEIRLLLTNLTLVDLKNFEGIVNQWCINKHLQTKFEYLYRTKFVESEIIFKIQELDW